MKLNILITLVLMTILGLNACTSVKKPTLYYIDKEKNINDIENLLKQNMAYKSHKAIAVAMDSEGKYILGYSYDCASEESAKSIALNRCRLANENAESESQVTATCVIYALENNIVHKL